MLAHKLYKYSRLELVWAECTPAVRAQRARTCPIWKDIAARTSTRRYAMLNVNTHLCRDLYEVIDVQET